MRVCWFHAKGWCLQEFNDSVRFSLMKKSTKWRLGSRYLRLSGPIATCLVGLLKKAASGVPCLRRSGFAQAGRHFSVLTYWKYALRAKMTAAFPSA
ncbi:hypothetical protein [Nitrospira sp.]|uniref:hypothetical protein n=1 Tax=Nitrospira sp. TaxID=70125 RepID=UPI003FCD87CD